MARRNMDYADWKQGLDALTNKPALSAADKLELDALTGHSPGGVAGNLGLTRQRVHQLIDEDWLDAVYVWEDSRKQAKKRGAQPSMILISDASVDRLRASRMREQLDLLPVKKRRKVS